LLTCADACLNDGDFLQCAVHLEGAQKKIIFDEFQMNIFDAISGV
jgi:hypothetical protein